jgi:beta-N-acetylhexosaminidase
MQPIPEQTTVGNFGQMFMLAFDGTELPADLAEFFRRFRIGGIILFGDNYRDPSQLRALTERLQRLCAGDGPPLFIATDHEGGRVQRFRSGFTRLPPIAELGVGSPEQTRRLYAQAAAELRACGVNFNLAPVADLCDRTQAGAIGDRAFGEDPDNVCLHVAAAISGLQQAGIMACAKHFPGHGATAVDSHRDLPVVALDAEALERRDLAPFRAAIAANVAAVMTGHVVYPNAGDPVWPASLSEYWMRRVLRQAMLFSGLVVTDAVEMEGLSRHWGPLEAGRRAIAAGTDVLIYYRIEEQLAAVYELRRALIRADIDRSRIAESLTRIARTKQRWLYPAGLSGIPAA